MRITVNGDPREMPEGATVADLVRELGLSRFAYAVERNREVLPRSEHESTLLVEEDRLEVVTFVGGG